MGPGEGWLGKSSLRETLEMNGFALLCVDENLLIGNIVVPM